MPIIEDDVKRAMGNWLKAKGYIDVEIRLGTRQGHDVEGKNPITGKRLVIECKGEAKTGNQHSKSWPNVASALLTSLNEIENPKNTNNVGVALPDTKEYRDRMQLLQVFCSKQAINVFWISQGMQVEQW
jgi:hypothetical protein